MKKLKFELSSNLGEVLTKAELKNVVGGAGFGNGSDDSEEKCNGSNKQMGCEGKAKGASCYYCDIDGIVREGKCTGFDPFAPTCWGGNRQKK